MGRVERRREGERKAKRLALVSISSSLCHFSNDPSRWHLIPVSSPFASPPRASLIAPSEVQLDQAVRLLRTVSTLTSTAPFRQDVSSFSHYDFILTFQFCKTFAQVQSCLHPMPLPHSVGNYLYWLLFVCFFSLLLLKWKKIVYSLITLSPFLKQKVGLPTYYYAPIF